MRLRKFFSKAQDNSKLGICFRQQSITYCHIASNEPTNCQQLIAIDKNYLPALKSLDEELSLSGCCHLVLSSTQSQIVQIEKPNVPENEISEALKWQVKDLVTIDPNDMVVDYFDGPAIAGGGEKINVVCAQKSELSSLVEQLIKSDFQVENISIEEFAFANLVPVNNDAILLICQQPNEEINLLIIKQGKLYFHRRLRGMAQIANKSEDELSMGVVDSLSLEIQRSTDYFERQLKQAPIRRIDVLVPMNNEAFLARKLAENTHVAVDLFTMPEGFENQREFAASIGATMGNHMEESA